MLDEMPPCWKVRTYFLAKFPVPQNVRSSIQVSAQRYMQPPQIPDNIILKGKQTNNNKKQTNNNKNTKPVALIARIIPESFCPNVAQVMLEYMPPQIPDNIF